MHRQVSRDHHTVPKLYLRGFCGKKGFDKDVLLARYRDGSEHRLTLKEATVEVDFYDIGEEGAPDDALEHWFDRAVENRVGELMAKLRRGRLSAEATARAALASFVAVQLVRTIAFRQLMDDMSSHLGPQLFATALLQRAIDNDPTLKQDGQKLATLHRQIVEQAPASVRSGGKKSMMRNMIREADRLGPLLGAMNWVLTSSEQPVLLTGDNPVVVVSPTGDTQSAAMLVPDLHELHMPITPYRLLTITPFPSLTQRPQLSYRQADIVNHAIVRNCSTTVLRRPDMDWPSDLTLPLVRTALAPPAVTVRPNAGSPASAPVWPPIVDRALAEALGLLGGDPDL
jgi:hypothetical protein